MDNMLHKCIENFGYAPRRLSLWDRLTYFRVAMPPWLREDPYDKLNNHFKNLKTLFVDGVVTWGHVIQANALMFKDSPLNCPGELVYSIENESGADPKHLETVARQMYRLKGTATDEPELQPIADYLANELIRVFGLPVPKSISPSVNCMISTTLFERKHLPRRRLCSSLMPIIVNPQEPHIVTPLPARYWPEPLVEWWVSEP